MRIWKSALLTVSLFIPGLLYGGSVQAQAIHRTATDIALKNGESTEVGDVYFISTDCKSVLKATPTVDILDGPPGVSATINPADVVPTGYSCAKPIRGGKLVITAKDIPMYSHSRMTLRINFSTLTGERQRAENFYITLFPAD